MLRAGLTAFTTMFLLLAPAQCAFLCAGQVCSDAAKNESTPPCHRHHNSSNHPAPASCVHQSLTAPGVSPQFAQAAFAPLVALATPAQSLSASIPAGARADGPYSANFSTPAAEAPSSAVLRI